jgi:serine/threonine-protein kinase
MLAHDGPLGIDRSVEVADQVLQALSAAHRAGIVHRDVKPGNVLVTADGVAKLSDFGIAKRLDDLNGDLTMPGHVVGTPSSMAPEQVTGGPATAATDVYATGVLLFQVLVNHPPFDAGSPMAMALAHRDAPVPDVRERRADVPAEIAAVIAKAMAKNPADRFASADEMRAALAPVANGETPQVRPESFHAPGGRTSVATAVLPVPVAAAPRRTWWWVAVGVAAAVTAAVFVLGRGHSPPERATATSVPTTATASITSPATAPPATTAAAAPAVTAVPTAPGTSTPVPVVPSVPVAPSTMAEVTALIDDDPGQFGPHAAEIRRDLERIAERTGRQLERDVQRLRARLIDWSTDGSINPDAAALVDSVLAEGTAGDQEDQADQRDG